MKYARYPVKASSDFLIYIFFSEGPQGRIPKAVMYSQIQENLFNLSFGDWVEEVQQLDDKCRSNNGDRDKVLATVAFTAIDFTNLYPDARIHIEGSTLSRTRLYQMGIGDNLQEISTNFKVEGFFEGYWAPFQRGQNYESFLIKRK